MNLEENKDYILKENVPEGQMKAYFEVLEDNTSPFRLEGNSTPHYMCRIHKVTVDGEDKTEEYLEKAFNGEKTRGIPTSKVQESEIEPA